MTLLPKTEGWFSLSSSLSLLLGSDEGVWQLQPTQTHRSRAQPGLQQHWTCWLLLDGLSHAFLGHSVRPGELSKLSVIQHNRWRGSTSDVCESHRAPPNSLSQLTLHPLAKELDLDLHASHVCQPFLQ